MIVPETTPADVVSANVPATVLGAFAVAPLVTVSVSVAPDDGRGRAGLDRDLHGSERRRR